MFDYTRAAINKVINDFKKLGLGINFCAQGLTIAYLIYALCTNTGVLVANIILLSLSVAYLIFFIYILKAEVKKEVKRKVKEFYQWCKRGVKLFSIGVTAYGIVITNSNFDLISLLLLLFTIIGWILEFLFYLVCKFLEVEKQLLLDGIKADMDTYTKPFRSVGNFVKKMTGKPVEEEPAPTKNRTILDKLVKKEKEKKQEQRNAKRSKFASFMRGTLDIFKKKSDPEIGEEIYVEQTPAPLEEQAFTEIPEE